MRAPLLSFLSALALGVALSTVGACSRSYPFDLDEGDDGPCPGVLVRCDGACVDLDTDPRHCGLCGISCARGEFCVEGACEDACPTAVCGDACVDLATSPVHCGACGNPCGDTGFCEGGACSDRCPAPLTRCGVECLDVAIDPDACGGCGVTCADDEVCGEGTCRLECPSGTTACDGSCVELDSSPLHCGGCGIRCATSAVCRTGRCIPVRELTDEDGDGIADLDEGRDALPPTDTDGDGRPDWLDDDSDGDGIPDAVEGGDDDPATPPVDTDGDGVPDYRDADSDADGLPDRDEALSGCLDPTQVDTDDDGQSDLAEVAASTDPCDPESRIPEFFFVLPIDDPSGESAATLTFDTSIRRADVHMSVDTTGSMGGVIDDLQLSLLTAVVPGIRARIPDVAFGVSEFEDFPVAPFGASPCSSGEPDAPFRLRQQVTTDEGAVDAAIGELDMPIGCGADLPESGYEALYQIATGRGVAWPGGAVPPFAPDPDTPGGGDLGGAGFRRDALPIVIHVTDERAHAREDYTTNAFPIAAAHSKADALAALGELRARVLGIATARNARAHLEELALETGGFIPAEDDGTCPAGLEGVDPVTVDGDLVCPLVYDGARVSATLVEGVVDLVTGIQLETVSVRVVGDDAGFIQGTIPRSAEVPEGAEAPGVTDLDGDSVFDSFTGVTPGTLVTFTILAENDVVEATDEDQVFTLTLQIVGDGVAVLDQQLVVVVVPRRVE